LFLTRKILILYRSTVNEVATPLTMVGGVHLQVRLGLFKNLIRKYRVDPTTHHGVCGGGGGCNFIHCTPVSVINLLLVVRSESTECQSTGVDFKPSLEVEEIQVEELLTNWNKLKSIETISGWLSVEIDSKSSSQLNQVDWNRLKSNSVDYWYSMGTLSGIQNGLYTLSFTYKLLQLILAVRKEVSWSHKSYFQITDDQSVYRSFLVAVRKAKIEKKPQNIRYSWYQISVWLHWYFF